MKELKERTSEVIERVASGERVAVTRRNELAAVILSIDKALEFVLAHAEDFVRARARTRSEYSWHEALDPYEVRFHRPNAVPVGAFGWRP